MHQQIGINPKRYNIRLLIMLEIPDDYAFFSGTQGLEEEPYF